MKREEQAAEEYNPFAFLKQGSDTQFDSAMKSMQSSYDDIFGDSSKYDTMFQTFKTENNPIIEPINAMSKQVFQTKPLDDKYVKQKNTGFENNGGPRYAAYQQEQEIIIGEPVYEQQYQQQSYQGFQHNLNNYYGDQQQYGPYYQQQQQQHYQPQQQQGGYFQRGI